MTIVHKSGNIYKKADGLSRCALANTPDNTAYVPFEAEPQIPIEGINITDIGTEFFEDFRESYKQNKKVIVFCIAAKVLHAFRLTFGNIKKIVKKRFSYSNMYRFAVLL
ncbi:hypothetical protein O181_043547 [Austropuccinia psidii MF-1]|uniref:Uncharacterized protein n=1 Tax=Austropuccinia psidii MF-1 TaxID=1389203 RepID=A0A9Q3HGY0_9BASI|nr:hypothetical protein [Austropuccinia psidii MF-1]